MLVDHYGSACKMCDRPFTVFKWRPGRGEGYKKTEVSLYRENVETLYLYAWIVSKGVSNMRSSKEPLSNMSFGSAVRYLRPQNASHLAHSS
jgi:hypothetical protein